MERDSGKSLFGEFDAPSNLYFIFMTLLITLFYGVLTWYCDHVISHNRGKSDGWFFFLRKKYWSCL